MSATINPVSPIPAPPPMPEPPEAVLPRHPADVWLDKGWMYGAALSFVSTIALLIMSGREADSGKSDAGLLASAVGYVAAIFCILTLICFVQGLAERKAQRLEAKNDRRQALEQWRADVQQHYERWAALQQIPHDLGPRAFKVALISAKAQAAANEALRTHDLTRLTLQLQNDLAVKELELRYLQGDAATEAQNSLVRLRGTLAEVEEINKLPEGPQKQALFRAWLNRH